MFLDVVFDKIVGLETIRKDFNFWRNEWPELYEGYSFEDYLYECINSGALIPLN